MKLREGVEKYGARKVAIGILDRALLRNFGMGYDDMPDTAERCSTVDELEDLLKDDPEKNLQQIQEIVRNATSWDNIVGGGVLD